VVQAEVTAKFTRMSDDGDDHPLAHNYLDEVVG
jgi:hypothetical protein